MVGLMWPQVNKTGQAVGGGGGRGVTWVKLHVTSHLQEVYISVSKNIFDTKAKKL